MELTKNADRDKYGYSGYDIGFDARSQFSLPEGSWGGGGGEMPLFYGVDNSYSVLVDIENKDILVLG